MAAEPLTIEWEHIPSQDAEDRLLEVFNILLNDENLYENQSEETAV
jgi:hypothetical protein